MFKIIRRILLVVLILIGLLVLMRNQIGIWITQSKLQKVTSFPATISGLDIKLTRFHVVARDIVIHNPKDLYQEPLAMKIHLFEGYYAPTSFLGSEPHFEKISLDIPEIVVVKNQNGEINLKRIQNHRKNQTAADSKFQIDELVLSVGKITYLDETKQPVETKTYQVNLRDRSYENLRSSEDIKKVVLNVVTRSLPQNLHGLVPETLKQNVQDLLQKGQGSLLNTFKGE
jgi:uncharacterized protein involved in outer membrane biogenesis